VAFAVGIDVDRQDAAGGSTNGTKNSQITGIICKPAGSSTFLHVVDNTDSTLFWQEPINCSTSNTVAKAFISAPALDNYNNIYFEGVYTNNTLFACDQFPSNAVYEAVANDRFHPTAWTTRILMKQGDTWINPTTGDTNMLFALPFIQSPSTRTIGSRSLGANAINRTQLSGYTVDNTTPGSAYAFGGIVVQATITNLTQQFRTDALLYIAPYTVVPPFQITSITRSGSDITLTWNGLAGNNVVQAVNGGNYTNNFSDVATVTVSSDGDVATYTDTGAAPPSSVNRYYRIKVTQ